MVWCYLASAPALLHRQLGGHTERVAYLSLPRPAGYRSSASCCEGSAGLTMDPLTDVNFKKRHAGTQAS